MGCRIEQEKIAQTIAFHGHSCPGLAIGIRAAELALGKMPDVGQENLVCVTETDMCGVDAIQFLTGCTFGKGNLVHRDYGKVAFSFYDRKSGKGIRLLFKPRFRGDMDSELKDLMAKSMQGPLSNEEQVRLQKMRTDRQQRLMSLPVEEIFTVESLADTPPGAARVLKSLACEECGEDTMESRTRRFAGKTLCIPCYLKVEQKI
jgi:formylmethanofuran dehydrogenase subunit E